MTQPIAPFSLTLLLAAMVGIIPFSIDAYLPAIAVMAEDLGVGLHQLELTVSAFLFGYAVGSLIGGPLSDHYGRRLIGVSGLLIFILASLAITQSEGYESMLWLRFLQAIGGGFTTVVVPAIVRDLYQREQAAKVLTTISFIMLAAPLLAPIVGSGILALWGWVPIFLFLASYATILMLIAQRYLPHSRSDAQKRAPLSLKQIARDYRFVAKDKPSRPYLIALTCAQGVFLTYITQAAFLIVEYMGLTPAQFPIVFCVFVAGLMIVNRANAFLLKRHDSRVLYIWGTRLVWAGSVCFAISATLLPEKTYWVMACVFFVVAPIGFINSNAQANYLHYFPNSSGTANALMRTCQLGAGGLFGALASAFYDGSPLPIALVMLAGSSVAFIAARYSQPVIDEQAAKP